VNLASLVERAHGNAREKGFWPLTLRLDVDSAPVIDWNHEDADIPTKFALIHSEISEALEAYRNPKWEVTKTYADISGNGTCWVEYDQASRNARKLLKPEGLPSELADVVIRCADLAGAYGYEFKTMPDFSWAGTMLLYSECWSDNVGANLNKLHVEIVVANQGPKQGSRENDRMRPLRHLVAACFSLADFMGIDLWREIDIKTGYNATRSARHGNRRA
jgi:hypothetical protein